MRKNPYEKSVNKLAPLIMRGMSTHSFLTTNIDLKESIEREISKPTSVRYDVSPTISFNMVTPPLKELCVDADYDDAFNVQGLPIPESKMGKRLSKKIQMCTTECTQELFEFITGRNPSYFKGPRNPVENVSWFDALDFCNKLSLKLGLDPCYVLTDVSRGKSGLHIQLQNSVEDGITSAKVQVLRTNGFRLPQKGEWVFFANTGTVGDTNLDNVFSGTKNESVLDEYAWFDETSFGTTHEVGTMKPNAWGMYDMSGNVSEWCEDDVRKGHFFDEDDPPTYFTMGGCYNSGYLGCNLSSFGHDFRKSPYRFSSEVGFRFCKSSKNL